MCERHLQCLEREQKLDQVSQKVDESERSTPIGTIDGLRAAGALGIHTAGTGVQRLERRPAWPSSGFDPNLPA